MNAYKSNIVKRRGHNANYEGKYERIVVRAYQEMCCLTTPT